MLLLGAFETLLLARDLVEWRDGVPAMGLLAGGGWLAVALATARPAALGHNRAVTRGLARIGGFLAAVGALVVWREAAPLAGLDRDALRVVTATGVAGMMLALRARLGAGDGAAALAAALACLAAAFHPRFPDAVAWALVATAGASACVSFGRSEAVRIAAVGAALVAIVRAFAQGWAEDPSWLAAGLAAGAAWLAAVPLLPSSGGRRTGGGVLVGASLVLATTWIVAAYGTDLAPVATPLLDPTTLAAVAIAASALSHARRAGRTEARAISVAIAVGVLVLAGHREVSSAAASLASDGLRTFQALHAGLAGLLLAILGRRPGREGLRDTGLGFALFAVGMVLVDARGPRGSSWAPFEVLAASLPLFGVALALARSEAYRLRAAAIGMGALAWTWATYAFGGRFAVEDAALNARFAVGALVLAQMVVVFRRARPADRGPLGTPYLGGVLATGYLLGLAEVMEVGRLLTGAWGAVLTTVYTTFFAAGVLAVGFVRADPRLRYAALAAFVAVILKVGVHDLSTAPLPLRILATGILGLVLLTAAWAYARGRAAERANGGVP
jgi:hypothetical protein